MPGSSALLECTSRNPGELTPFPRPVTIERPKTKRFQELDGFPERAYHARSLRRDHRRCRTDRPLRRFLRGPARDVGQAHRRLAATGRPTDRALSGEDDL